MALGGHGPLVSPSHRNLYASAAASRAEYGHHPEIAEPLKVGNFDIDGENHIGMFPRDRFIVELTSPPPSDMLELIERCEHGVKKRLYEIVNYLHPQNLTSTIRGAVHNLENVRTSAPLSIKDPQCGRHSLNMLDRGTEEQWAATRRKLRENRGVH